MLFSNEFISLKLKEGVRQHSTGMMLMDIYRNHPKYKVKKGIVIETQVLGSHERFVEGIWFTDDPEEVEFNNYNSDTVDLIVDNKVLFEITYDLVFNKKGLMQRQGERVVYVRLKENLPEAESQTLLEGMITLKGIETRAPQANHLKTKFKKIGDNYRIAVEVRGINPYNHYDCYLKVGPLDNITISGANHKYEQTIPSAMFNRKIDIDYGFKFNDLVIENIHKVFSMPGEGIKGYIYDEGLLKKIKHVWIKVNDEWVLAHRFHYKSFETFKTKL